ncbi:cyclic nucleotide-binding domain-containing protein [Rudanella paleaurantiibacter]|uniref:Cyclic nucleotide-binding domain-containing protein n=1 Tax=Rudanella paleaurantiibacter TaxID=2614655 RepID=A0A7J5U2D7_9BACT|nr:Crp/Fnr family transcriptional regulator [Rudanella paleaurantiibacter]KAB7731846.1 cyclic nucleotide-binding domain-containing protein [Rudanella paleaurantiibacter]
MQTELLDFVSKFGLLTPAEATEIARNIPVRLFKKGTYLLREGEIAQACYFVLTGCVRQYRLLDGVEKTTAFFTEEQAVVDFNSYANQVPSRFYMVCTEDCLLIEGNLNHEQAMYHQFPKLVAITRDMMEQNLGQMQDELATFTTLSPEERYKHLQRHRPVLLQRVPQHQIASYLGVTPESLSRIRKRLSTKT